MKRNKTVYKMSIVALLIGIMALMGFTPIGTIQAGVLTITLLGIPLAISACIFGPYYGALLGLVWGVIAIVQSITGMDPLGATLITINPLGLIVTCIVPRVLTGYLAGLIYKLNAKWDKKGHINSVVTCALVTVFNTVFFMTSLALFFFNTPELQAIAQTLSNTYGVNAFNPFLFIVFAVGINFLVEIAVNAIVGSAAVFGLEKATKHLNIKEDMK